MPENEARAWWADVQHVRESIERRRGGVAESAARIDPEPEPQGRFARAGAEPPVPRLEDLDWPPDVPARDGRRFEHAAERAEGGASDDARPTRRRPSAPAEADRAVARGRRIRTESDRSRTRSHRADDPSAASDPRAASARGPATRPAAANQQIRTLNRGTPPTTSGAPEYDLAQGLGLVRSSPARRTVQITGRTVPAPSLPRLVEVERRRPGRRPAERVGPRPDRIALYAVLLGFFLILVAAASSHA